jgi:hypothetical protein
MLTVPDSAFVLTLASAPLPGIIATGTPSAPCLRMNAFCLPENLIAFIVFRSSQPKRNDAENSS